MEQWKNMSWSEELHFVLIHVTGECMCVIYWEKKWQRDAVQEEARLTGAARKPGIHVTVTVAWAHNWNNSSPWMFMIYRT